MIKRIVLLALAAAAAAQYNGGGSAGCDLCSASSGGGSMGGRSRPTAIRLRYTGSNSGATNNRQGARGGRVRTPAAPPPPRSRLLSSVQRLFYGCSYRFHLSGDNSRDRYASMTRGIRNRPQLMTETAPSS